MLCEEAGRILAKAKFAIAFTGAGISAESGVPTFRDANGLWRNYRPEELATPEAFRRNPQLVWEFYKWRMQLIAKARPNKAHLALARLEEMGILKAVITQNVDDLHREAGTKNLIELHGNIFRVRCTSCTYRENLKESGRLEEFLSSRDLPRCPRCNSLLRPDVVWFGEPLPQDALERAFELASRADVVLVIGTSGVVYPAAYIPYVVKEHGGRVIEINPKRSGITPIADVFIPKPAGEGMERILKAVEVFLGAKGSGNRLQP
ncbi:NAD-dependent protein deacetylase [Thermococcus sp. AM4]|uniref:NAD-dependent protein deacetylase n=1 Tax=Thermococcus sp. (strain AM4) TaxID=246969 RepID=UPI0001870738|nr:NAD-dependent protein deacetylase [Thermococcus sp. AM4]EEB73286.1 NAD-dependent protein deacetylase of SIR2 family [Thermococcus sp. AM4]